MRKQAEDNYLKSLSKYNVVFYWHFVILSSIVVLVVYFTYKTIDVMAVSNNKEYDHFDEDLMYEPKYANYLLNIYEPYNPNEISNEDTKSEDIVDSKEIEIVDDNAETKENSNIFVEVNEQNSDNQNYKENASNLTINEQKTVAKDTTLVDTTNNFVKKQDNLDNTIEKSSEIVYNNIAKDNVSKPTNEIRVDSTTTEQGMVLKIIVDENNFSNDLSNIVVSEDELNTFKKLQLDYINNFYYNYIEKYYTNDTAIYNFEEGVSLYQIFLFNELLKEIESNDVVFSKDKSTEGNLDSKK